MTSVKPGAQNLRKFLIEDWHVDLDANRLSRAGIELKLESKVMAVLDYLVQKRGELVTREDLEGAVWGHTVVGYDALTRCIAKLRKALEDDPRKPRFIETISKKGYRLIAPVHQLQVEPVTADVMHKPSIWKSQWVLPVIIGLLLSIAAVYFVNKETQPNSVDTQRLTRPSIVVLPFENPGNNQQERYFSDGVTADISTALSKLSGLFVIAHASANTSRAQGMAIKDVAKTLGARYVLSGNMRRAGRRLRVNVQLIEAETAYVLWSEKYDREASDVFAVQDNIVRNIVNTLAVKLTEEEKQRTARRYTVSLEAYDDFLKGQSLYIHHSKEDNLRAREYYRRAVERDSLFARAYSAMALTYMSEHRYGWAQASSTHAMDQALQLGEKGVFLDPDLPQAHWALGYVHLFRTEYAAAEIAARRAIELDPSYADSYLILAICALYQDAPAQALQLVRKAMLLNPEYPSGYASVLGQAHYYLGHYDQAVSVLRQVIERNVNLLTARVFLIASLSELGQSDEAVWAAAELKAVDAEFSTEKALELLPVKDAKTLASIKRHLQRAGF